MVMMLMIVNGVGDVGNNVTGDASDDDIVGDDTGDDAGDGVGRAKADAGTARAVAAAGDDDADTPPRGARLRSRRSAPARGV